MLTVYAFKIQGYDNKFGDLWIYLVPHRLSAVSSEVSACKTKPLVTGLDPDSPGAR